MTSSPKISIIVTCYNYGQYVSECIQSVIDQSFENWECLVIDDGSTDNSQEEIRRFISDKRISYFFQQNSGVSKARNLGISIAKGDFLLMLDADDKLHKNCLDRFNLCFAKDPGITLVYPQVEFFGSAKGTWKLPEYSFSSLLADNMIVATSMYRRSEIERIGGYDEKMLHGSEDWEFWIRLLYKNRKTSKLDDVSFYYRIKPKSRNTTILKNENIKFDVYKYISQKHALVYAEFFESPLVLFHKLHAITTEKNYMIDHPIEFWYKRLVAKIKRKLS